MSLKSAIRTVAEDVLARSPKGIAKFTKPYDAVSFDVFDTLVYRRLNGALDVPSLVDVRCAFGRYGVGPYRDVRRRAEGLARKKKNLEEITFDDIIGELKGLVPAASDADINSLAAAELEAEREVLTARPEMLGVFERIRVEKRLSLVSDMYLDEAFIEEVLTGCGYCLDGVDVFVSSEFGLTKRTGHLFEVAHGSESVKACHIGDNLATDYLSPRKCGIDAFLIRKQKVL